MQATDIALLAEKARSNGCLITGADLLVIDEGKTLHGDLHMVGETFVFNGVLAGGNRWEAAWSWDEPRADRLVILASGCRYFERRGVIVLAAKDTMLSDEARRYLGLGA